MAYEMKELTGSIFKNERKTTDQHPGGTGSCLIDGVEYFIDAWTNDSAKGKYQSLKFKRKDKQPMPKAAVASPRGKPEDFDDLPPF